MCVVQPFTFFSSLFIVNRLLSQQISYLIEKKKKKKPSQHLPKSLNSSSALIALVILELLFIC